MKKILALIVLLMAMVSCYEEYLNDYPITGIYFPIQQDVRSFIVGEGMKFEVGAALGGVRENTKDRNVSFTLDNTLITAARLTLMKAASQGYIKNATTPVAALQLLPTSFYSMTPSTTTMVIKAGQHSGTVVIRPDSVAFLNDSVKTIVSTYVLPFYITAADADSLPYLKRSNVVGVKFENKLFGNYWHGGEAVINRPAKTDSTVKYSTTIPCLENLIWTLTTIGPSTLVCNGYYKATTSAAATQLKLVLKGTTVFLSAATGSTYSFVAEGPCTFNNSKLLQERKIFLKYKYTDPVSGFTYHCTDTLTFRNRIRDGINEWQDENPDHYTK